MSEGNVDGENYLFTRLCGKKVVEGDKGAFILRNLKNGEEELLRNTAPSAVVLDIS
jgi:hypothetical protein